MCQGHSYGGKFRWRVSRHSNVRMGLETSRKIGNIMPAASLKQIATFPHMRDSSQNPFHKNSSEEGILRAERSNLFRTHPFSQKRICLTFPFPKVFGIGRCARGTPLEESFVGDPDFPTSPGPGNVNFLSDFESLRKYHRSHVKVSNLYEPK